ncbi:MAG: glutamine-hydrolyzing GMP synthase [Eubacteriales bacterium]|nr:glutamine-hydrolyzing GMP synthase [Eubacteriales bacterium]
MNDNELNIKESILVLDFGGQYNQLIARRIRDLGVYAAVYSHKISIEKIKEINPKGIIFTGGPNSVFLEKSPHINKEIYELNIPILGICYGAQLIAYDFGGKVVKSKVGEYGKTYVKINKSSKLLKNVNDMTETFMNHSDHIQKEPNGFEVIANSDTCISCIQNEEKNIYAIQWHPEVKHTIEGEKIFSNFIFDICKCSKNWSMDDFIEKQVLEIKNKCNNKKVILALSGGIDSATVACLISRAIGKNLYCVFVNHGLLRKDEEKEVEKVFNNNKLLDLNFIEVDAKERFLKKLENIIDPEKKRKIIGSEFIKVFEEEAKKIGDIQYLAQGTIYPDIIESGLNGSAIIKSHHNVGGLPKDLMFQKILEPLKFLFKDEVRKVALKLNLPESIVYRQPFPGPGLAIRIMGDVNEEKLNIVKEADYILREELEKAKLPNLSQYFASLSNMKSVGVMGDYRTYDYAVVLRIVHTDDFMTANTVDVPYDILQKIMNRIVNEVKGVNRVFYDLTSKPPGTIEFE